MIFLRSESLKQFIRWYPVITGIIIIHLILYILTNIISVEFEFMLSGQNIFIAKGEYWRLVTAIFVHFGLGHVLFNSFSLVLFGPPLERMLGKFKFILTYLLMGIIGNVATFYLSNPLGLHAGASGAIFGLFGIYMYIVFMRKELIDPQSRQIVTVITVIALAMTFLRTGINIYAHIFGLMAGLALAPIVLNKVRRIYY
ncbi:rhomboid family protein [Bacillaceae bacterium W0354]